MKAIMFLLLATLPVLMHAQEASSDSQHVKIHFRKITLKRDGMIMTNYTRPGDLSLCDSNTIAVSGPLNIDMTHGRKNMHANDWLVSATDVEITDPAGKAMLKADHLSYNNITMQGTLTGHVMLIGKSAQKKLGKTAEVDFNNKQFRIVSVVE